ncbi:hypothetical protein, partial [Caballeronia choica]|uniref:hypothetical protein n=1 Tax=Caballeronia choica TaxID=326476 RepID=UPI001F1B791C
FRRPGTRGDERAKQRSGEVKANAEVLVPKLRQTLHLEFLRLAIVPDVQARSGIGQSGNCSHHVLCIIT